MRSLKPVLRCTECHRKADDDARGWRALLGREFPEDQPETLAFCPECAAREFGEIVRPSEPS